jgi:hypothetical protein
MSFLIRRECMYVCKHTVKMPRRHVTVSEKFHQSGCETGRAVSRGQNELIGDFKMAADDVIKGHSLIT